MRVEATAVALLIAWVGQGLAASSTQSLPPGVSAEDAHAGCVRTDLKPCMLSLGTAFWFDMNLVAAQIAKRNETDVNGKTAHRKIIIDAKLPNHHELIGITLTLASPAPNDQVVKVALTLPQDPDLAHTASEYDRTELYDTVSVVLGNRCPALDKMALYRFYENTIKPRETVKTEVQKKGPFNHTKQTIDTEKAPFCGAMFSLHRGAEWDGSPDFPGKGLKGVLSSIEIE
jgi:hypothetical protein